MKNLKGNATELLDLLPRRRNRDQSWYCFASPEAACAFLESKPRTSYWTSTSGLDDASDSFYGSVSQAGAIAMCRAGWPEGAARVARMRDRINAARPYTKALAKWDVAGAVASVPRALAGNPLSMRRADRNNRRRPVLTLVNHMGGMADVRPETFVNKCAAVAAIVDAIEAAGFSCHVIGLSMVSAEKNGEGYFCGVATTVKEASQSVDVGRMAFALGHIAMFRRIVFGLRASDAMNKPLMGMGRTCDFDTAPAEGCFIVPSMNANEDKFLTEDTAATVGVDYLVAELSRQGCSAFPNSLAA